MVLEKGGIEHVLTYMLPLWTNQIFRPPMSFVYIPND